MRKLVLDISNCRLNDLLQKDLKGIKNIPIVPGRYGKEYDVVEADLPGEVVQVLRNRMGKGFRAESKAFDRPMGIDMDRAPHGAKIKEIES